MKSKSGNHWLIFNRIVLRIQTEAFVKRLSSLPFLGFQKNTAGNPIKVALKLALVRQLSYSSNLEENDFRNRRQLPIVSVLDCAANMPTLIQTIQGESSGLCFNKMLTYIVLTCTVSVFE